MPATRTKRDRSGRFAGSSPAVKAPAPAPQISRPASKPQFAFTEPAFSANPHGEYDAWEIERAQHVAALERAAAHPGRGRILAGLLTRLIRGKMPTNFRDSWREANVRDASVRRHRRSIRSFTDLQLTLCQQCWGSGIPRDHASQHTGHASCPTCGRSNRTVTGKVTATLTWTAAR